MDTPDRRGGGCYAVGMEARDFRGIGRAAQEELRRRALWLIELRKRTRSVLRAIQRSPERVRAYFRPEPVRYAA